MRVSVVTTVRNEEGSIEEFLKSVFSQSHKPDQVVISDGLSTDNTLEIMRSFQKQYPTLVVITARGNIARGRNAAISIADGEVIAVTDAGQRLDPDWLKEIIKPFADPAISVVSGYFQPDPKTTFEAVSTALINQTAEELDDSWLPSSRSIAFKKLAWEKVGGYPEQLTFAGEDTLFDLKLKNSGFNFKFAPRAVVYWRPRPGTKSFFKQFYLYGKGDGQYWPQAQGYGKKIIIYATVLLALAAGALLKLDWLIGAALVLYLLYVVFRGRKTLQRSGRIDYMVLSWPLVVIHDLAALMGYFRGVIDWLLNPKLRLNHEK